MACVVVMAALWTDQVSRLLAADGPNWTAAPAKPTDYTFLDLELSLRARNALREDAALATQDLGVSVRNRVAILWGDVASREVAQRAEARLQQVLGLNGIRNELHIKQSRQPTDKMQALPPLRQPGYVADAAVPQRLQSQESFVRRPSERGPISGQEMLWRPPFPGRQITPSPSGSPAVSRDNRPDPGPDGAPALPGWRPKQMANQQNQITNAVIPPLTLSPSSAHSPAGSLLQAVEAVRRKDDRFAQIRPEVKGGVIYLRGAVKHSEHLYELARAISLLPGVERVILEDSQPSPK
jgi:osmotically-inducible protein OsmY